MSIDHNDLVEGIKVGMEKLKRDIKVTDPEPGDQFRKLVLDVLNRWPSDLSPRFVRLFAELSTIAAVSRREYKHHTLSEDDLNAYLGHSVLFFNSFRHK